MPKLSEKTVDALAPREREYVVWDTRIIGLGVRVRPSGAKSFILVYRRGGRQRKHTMGKARLDYGLKEARDRAGELLRALRDGVDPQSAKMLERGAPTVAQLVEAYLAEGPALKPDKKASSWKADRGLLECHVRPLLGGRLARDLTKLDIAKLQDDIAEGRTARDVRTGPRRRSRVTGGRTVAALTVAILGACYQFGVETGRVAHNPTKGVRRFKIKRRERYLSEHEVEVIGEALAEFEDRDPRLSVMADAVRLLLFTGCRKSEILNLRWAWVDFDKGCLRLPDSKTGPKVVPLADPALVLLRRRWRARPAIDPSTPYGAEPPMAKPRSPFVLPAMKGAGAYVGLPHHWEKLRARADDLARRNAARLGQHPDDVASLRNVRLHDLRHSFASFAIADGASLFMVGKLLGHKQARTTEIYAHLSEDPVRRVANRAATRLADALGLSRSGV